VATVASLIPASCRTVWSRWASRVRSWRRAFRVPREVPALPDRRWGHDAPPHEPALQQLRDPGAVGPIGRPPGHLGQVGGIDEEEGEALLDHGVHRFPGDPRALQGPMRHLVGGQPVPERQEIRSGGPEGLEDVCVFPAGAGKTQTGRDRGVVDIEARAALQDDGPWAPPVWPAPRGASRIETLLGVRVATGRGA